MKKLSILALLFVCIAAFVPLSAQTQTVRTISAAGVTSADGNLSAIIGIPFAGRAALGNRLLLLMISVQLTLAMLFM